MSKEAIDRIREQAQNEQTSSALHQLLCLAEAELKELRAFKQKVMELQPVGYLNIEVWKRCGENSVLVTPFKAFDNQTPLYDLKELK